MKMRFIPTHHELLIAEKCLRYSLIYLRHEYEILQALQLDKTDFDDDAKERQSDLCYLWDFILEVDKLLSRFDDFRHQDFLDRTYILKPSEDV